MKLSYSNLSTFRQCPKKWEYSYIEGLIEKDSENLLLGSIFHEILEKHYKDEDVTKVIKEYRDAVLDDKLSTDLHLMEEVYKRYTTYYSKKDSKEHILSVEAEMEAEWEDGDTIVGFADRIVEDNGLVVVRDTKTTQNPLKYTKQDVRYSPQLLLYAAMAELELEIKVDAIEIDEVRLADLQKPPMNKNGKPTADFRKLGLVTYERYYNTLVDLGLEDAEEYQYVLKRLKERGHPLFQRVRVKLDDQLVNTNINELYMSYKMMKHFTDPKTELNMPRHPSKLCNWCAYKELCALDYYNPTPEEREIMIHKNLVYKEKEDDEESDSKDSEHTEE